MCCRRCLEPHVPPLLKRVCTRSTQLISTTSGGTERSTQPISTTSGGAERVQRDAYGAHMRARENAAIQRGVASRWPDPGACVPTRPAIGLHFPPRTCQTTCTYRSAPAGHGTAVQLEPGPSNIAGPPERSVGRALALELGPRLLLRSAARAQHNAQARAEHISLHMCHVTSNQNIYHVRYRSTIISLYGCHIRSQFRHRT